MSTGDNGETSGGPKGSSESGIGQQGLPVEFIRHLARSALELSGELTPAAAIQVALRNTETRNEILDELVRCVSPLGVSPVVWSKWLDGGKPPFLEKPAKPELQKPTRPSERPANLVSRTSPRVTEQEEAVALAKAKLAQEEEYLALLRAHDNAALHFVVVNQLISLLEPIFAMGPAWTLMRAVSSHLPEEVGEFATGFLDGKQKEEALAKMRSDRTAESESMHALLDLFSGVTEFEEAVREALLKVCRDFDKRKDELLNDGRRARSKDKRNSEVHPKAQNDATDVLDGLKRAG